MQNILSRAGLIAVAALLACSPRALAQVPNITISFPAARSADPIDGRLFLLLSTDPSAEPRMQIDDTPKSQMIFGMNVDGMRPDASVVIADDAAGYPVRNLRDIPPGDYYVQGFLNRYETFHRADGKTIKLAPDRGEGQHWNLSPGNLYSKPQKLHVDASSKIALTLDQQIPPIPAQPDTKYIRHIRIQSDKLTK
ncbi:MAG TPA: hypothetical protein VNX22_09255, partial [Acidobacteriaceae bacterium]|nr:hypothetical protein [Acidobacteriaceae bacterium]